MLLSTPPTGGHYLVDVLAAGRQRLERSPSSENI
jgi:hypothetical protein